MSPGAPAKGKNEASFSHHHRRYHRIDDFDSAFSNRDHLYYFLGGKGIMPVILQGPDGYFNHGGEEPLDIQVTIVLQSDYHESHQSPPAIPRPRAERKSENLAAGGRGL